MNWKQLICAVLCICISAVSFAATYYLSPWGNDANSGLSPSNAWKTIQKLNTIDLNPGDIVLFEGNAVFTGNIYLDANDAGDAWQPVTISSYGTGKAIIEAGNSFGIMTYNCGGFRISNLLIRGSGATINTSSGIDVYMDATADLSFIRMDSCDVNGFGYYGVRIGSWNTIHGFNDVRVRYVNSFNNGDGGMSTYGFNNIINHKDFYVAYSSFHDNKGRADITHTNTGSGLVLSGIENAMVEYCEAYNNGENNTYPPGGPVGIWFYLVKNGLIQFCESHHNRSGTQDGGGFDLDGGTQNCIIQYCYSHDNAGPGYLMAEYGSNISFTNNTIRYNISQNDARKGLAGAITFWGADNNNRINQSYVHNNSIFVSTVNASGTPAAVKLVGDNFSGVKVFNNIFYTSGAVIFLHADANVDSAKLHFLFNDYYSASAQSSFVWAWNTYNSLAAWKSAAVTQERRGTQQSGTTLDPSLAAPGMGGIAGLAQLPQLAANLPGYKLQTGSGMSDAGIDVGTVTSVWQAPRDFFGNAPRHGITQDIGVHECADCFSVLNESSVTLNARTLQNGVHVTWRVNNTSLVKSYVLEYSINAKDFYVAQTVSANCPFEIYSIIDTVRYPGQYYYRLKVLLLNGSSFYSKIISVSPKDGLTLTAVRTDNGHRIMISSPAQQRIQFSILNTSGQLLQSTSRTVPEGISYHNTDLRLTPGIYLLNIADAAGRSQTIQLRGND